MIIYLIDFKVMYINNQINLHKKFYNFYKDENHN